MQLFSVCVISLLSLFLSASASAADLAIIVKNIRNDAGILLVAVCDAPSFLETGCPYQGRVAADGRQAELVFVDVEPGRYAVQIVHDENANETLDRNVLGVPKEGYGFSNNPASPFGPPSFDAAAIAVGEETIQVRVALRYLFD